MSVSYSFWHASIGSAEAARGAVLALSGGPDSAALLDYWIRAFPDRASVVGAHLDHGIRATSQEDCAIAAAQARIAGVRFLARRIELPGLVIPGEGGLEAAARTARYAYLEEVAVAEGFGLVATGHHLDDQAETVVLRLLRGAGCAGLAAIAPIRPIREGSPILLVRPLLELSRAALRARVTELGWPVARDMTNDDGSNLRSVVRTALLPPLLSAAPDLAERLSRVAAAARAIRRALPAPPDTRPAPVASPSAQRLLACPGSTSLPGLVTIRARRAPDADRGHEPVLAVIDARAAPPPYTLRCARETDRFRPLGLGAETSVFRFLKARHLSRRECVRTPVVLAAMNVVWVVGHRIDERAKVGPSTSDRVALAALPEGDGGAGQDSGFGG